MQDKLQTKIAPTKDSVIFKFSVPEDYLKNDTLRTTWKDITGNVEDSSVLKGYLDSNIKNTKDELNSTIGGLTNKVNDSIKDMQDKTQQLQDQIDNKLSNIDQFIKEYLQNELPNMDLSGLDFKQYLKVTDASIIYATKEELQQLAQKIGNDILQSQNNIKEWTNSQGFLTQHQDLTPYATKDYVHVAINDIDLSLYAKKTDIPTKVSQLSNT